MSSLLLSSPVERQARVKRANEPLTAGDESVDASESFFFSRRSAENLPEASNTAAPPDLLPAALRLRQERRAEPAPRIVTQTVTETVQTNTTFIRQSSACFAESHSS